MKLNVTPRYPVDAETSRFYKEIAQQVNALSEGRQVATYNSLTAAPTTGIWAKGDFILNSNPSELGTAGSKYFIHGWRCTVAGTPGTWVACKFLTDGTPVAGGASSGRELLTAARTYYVATTGSDSNDGLTVGTPFLTIQKAVDVTCSIDLSIYQVTIQLANGTYATTTSGVSLGPYVGNGPVSIVGNVATPSSVVVTSTTSPVFGASTGIWNISGMTLSSTGAGALVANYSGVILFSDIKFGQTFASHMSAGFGGTIQAVGNYSVSAGSSSGGHMYAVSGGRVLTTGRTVTLSGTPAFAAAWAWSDRGGGAFDAFGMTFTGTGATGSRYILALNSICFVNGGGASYFPGSVAGSTATGGQYI